MIAFDIFHFNRIHILYFPNTNKRMISTDDTSHSDNITQTLESKDTAAPAKKNPFKSSKFRVAGLGTSAITTIKSKEDVHRFKAGFKNDTAVPIDAFWIDYKGKEIQKKTKIPPGEKYTTNTFFTHHWFFRKSGEESGKLLCDANNITNIIFEGEKFIAVPNELLEIYIMESK